MQHQIVQHFWVNKVFTKIQNLIPRYGRQEQSKEPVLAASDKRLSDRRSFLMKHRVVSALSHWNRCNQSLSLHQVNFRGGKRKVRCEAEGGLRTE